MSNEIAVNTIREMIAGFERELAAIDEQRKAVKKKLAQHRRALHLLTGEPTRKVARTPRKGNHGQPQLTA